MSRIEDQILARWAAAERVAQALQAKRTTLAGMAKDAADGKLTMGDFVKKAMSHDAEINMALDEWIRSGGE